MSLTPVQKVVNALTDAGCGPKRSGSSWQARCPGHEDRSPSLSVAEGDDGRALLNCHAGCDLDAVLVALKLTAADLFPPKNGQRPDGERQVVATYRYVDEAGRLLFEAVRYQPKDFRQRRPDGNGGWIWNLKGVRRVPYRLPQLLAAIAAGAEVFIVEGERDVHSVEAAGQVATTGPMGAGKWSGEYVPFFAAADVIVVADRDTAGYDHARTVVASLTPVAASVRLCEPLEGKDVTDHLDAGHTLEELVLVGGDDEPAGEGRPTRLLLGGEFLFGDSDDVDQPLFGSGAEVLHSSGEATFVIAITGVGKSTYAQNYLLRRLGLVDSDFLGFPVTPLGPGEVVLYVGADRPRQIRRSWRRMVLADQRSELDRRLLVWKGPLPFVLNREPTRLASFVAELESEHDVVIRDVVLDSLKDVAFELSKDEGGAAVAQAINHAVAEGREVLVLHHERKPERGAKKAPADISDVYGSQFLTACAGNVIYLHGTPGGHTMALHHLKQSADQVGPLDLDYDHDSGALTTRPRPDLLDALRHAPKGMTVRTACYVLYGVDDPDKPTMARAYRRLERLVKAGLAWREKSSEAFDGATLYYPGTRAEAP